MIDVKKITKIISNFSKAKILVVGDLILDEYVYGDVDRISPEAPVPVVWAKKRDYLPGGSANVCANVSSLGAGVSVLGLTGEDDRSVILITELKKKKIQVNSIIKDSSRITSLKTRLIAGRQQIARVDWEDVQVIEKEIEEKVISSIKKNIEKFDALIIEDYGKGFITPNIVKEAVSLARAKQKVINIDPKEEHFEYYKGATCITPNRKEAENAIRNIKIRSGSGALKINSDRLFSDQDVDLAGEELLKYLKLDSLLITLGDKGMRLFEKEKKPYHIDTVAQEVFDVSGAGDTVIAVFTLALVCGAAMPVAARIANFAAGIVVGKMGAATTTQEELKEKIEANFLNGHKDTRTQSHK